MFLRRYIFKIGSGFINSAEYKIFVIKRRRQSGGGGGDVIGGINKQH